MVVLDEQMSRFNHKKDLFPRKITVLRSTSNVLPKEFAFDTFWSTYPSGGRAALSL